MIKSGYWKTTWHYVKGHWEYKPYKVATSKKSKYVTVKANTIVVTPQDDRNVTPTFPSQNIKPNDGRKYKLNVEKLTQEGIGFGVFISCGRAGNYWGALSGLYVFHEGYNKPMWIPE